ncbi:MAG: glycosyltransferase, partial [Cyclobacteriaceae bacterium]
MSQHNKLTVVHIIKGLGRGGAERLLVSTIRNHSSTYQFHVVYFLTLKDHLVSELSSAGATVHLISASSPLQMFLKLPALLRLLRLIRPNLLHAHLPLSGAVAALASWILGLPLVYTEHNLPSRYHRPTQFIHFFTVRRALKVLCVSRVVLNDLTDRYNVKSKTTLLEN